MSAEAIRSNLLRVRTSLPPGVRLVAVSKYHPAESILAAYAEGQRLFGESHTAHRESTSGSLGALRGVSLRRIRRVKEVSRNKRRIFLGDAISPQRANGEY